MKKMDRRVKKTRTLLKNGLITLMQEKSIKEITVQELVDLVDINRSTFYLHYKDIYDLVEQLEQEVFDSFKDLINNFGEKKEDEQFLIALYQNIKNYSDLAKALISSHGDMSFVHRLIMMIRSELAPFTASLLTDVPTDYQSYIYEYCLFGTLGLIKKWMERDFLESPETMAKLTHQLLIENLNQGNVLHG